MFRSEENRRQSISTPLRENIYLPGTLRPILIAEMENEYTFNVFSNKSGKTEPFTVKKTESGWHISHKMISGICDPAGEPVLFLSLHEEKISHPNDLGNYVEWLWHYSREKQLGHEQIQERLNELADWVGKCDAGSPEWEGYDY